MRASKKIGEGKILGSILWFYCSMILCFQGFLLGERSTHRISNYQKKSIIVLLAANHAIVNRQWGAFSFTKKLAWETFFANGMRMKFSRKWQIFDLKIFWRWKLRLFSDYWGFCMIKAIIVLNKVVKMLPFIVLPNKHTRTGCRFALIAEQKSWMKILSQWLHLKSTVDFSEGHSQHFMLHK